MNRYLAIILLGMFMVVGCSDKEPTVAGRWFTYKQVQDGAKLYRTNCALCHGKEAQGLTADWRKTLPDGSYPPPPLNGSAHTWHHQISLLRRTIRNGGVAFGGKMPPFEDKLSSTEIDSIISFFQSKWSDEIYDIWLQRGGLR